MEQHQHSPSDAGLVKPAAVALGEKLRRTREQKSLTVDQVQKQTRIHAPVIAALEEGRCAEMLPALYVKSYLKKYAQFLGLEPAEIVKEYGRGHADDVRVDISGLKPSSKESYLVSRFINILSVVILSVVVVTLVAFAGAKLTSAFKKPAAKPVVAASAVKPVPVTQSKPKTQKGFLGLTKPAAPKTSTVKNKPFNLDLKIKRAVLVEVKRDGDLLFKTILPKGTVERFSAKEKIEIYVAKAESIELVLNGKSLGSPGKGVINRLEITASGVKKY